VNLTEEKRKKVDLQNVVASLYVLRQGVSLHSCTHA